MRNYIFESSLPLQNKNTIRVKIENSGDKRNFFTPTRNSRATKLQSTEKSYERSKNNSPAVQKSVKFEKFLHHEDLIADVLSKA